MDNESQYDEETNEVVFELTMEERQAIAKKIMEEKYGTVEE